MAVTVGVHVAKTQLSRLLHRVESGEEIVITRGNHPVARLLPAASGRVRELGMDRGLVRVADDFDAPLPNDIMAAFQK
jgi:prevent-host-death family protein